MLRLSMASGRLQVYWLGHATATDVSGGICTPVQHWQRAAKVLEFGHKSAVKARGRTRMVSRKIFAGLLALVLGGALASNVMAEEASDSETQPDSVDGSGIDSVDGSGIDSVDGSGVDSVDGSGVDSVDGSEVEAAEDTDTEGKGEEDAEEGKEMVDDGG